MLYNIQALRAFAAGIVIFVHMGTVLAPIGIGQDLLSFGEAGVDLFFLISGFVMVHTVRRKPVGAADFLLNRVIRVVPLYWLLTLAVFAVALVAPSLLGGTRASIGDLIRSLLFIPYQRANGTIAPTLFVGWTLNFEMFFYLLFAIGLGITRGRLAGTVAFTTAALLAATIGGLLWRPEMVPLRFYSSPMMLEFGFGMIVGWLGLGLNRGRMSVDIATGVTIVGLLLLVSGRFLLPGVPRLLVAGLPALAVLWAALAAERNGAAVRQPRVQLLGAASYALYLTHPFVMQAFGKVSQRVGSAPVAWLLAMLGIVAVVLVAIVVHERVELPMTDALRRRVGHAPPLVERREPSVAEALARHD